MFDCRYTWKNKNTAITLSCKKNTYQNFKCILVLNAYGHNYKIIFIHNGNFVFHVEKHIRIKFNIQLE
jgi:hypothetical protein